MDIPKYIGLFLVKNSFCYLHGIGNLELKKKPARYEGDALHAPEYDVMLTPGGSIDDTFANFIATHEQTSISKAANALREWSTATRAELAAGKEVDVPGVGKFVDGAGLVKFVANPHFQHTPPPVPMLRMAKRLEDQPDFRRENAEQPQDGNGINIAWGRIGMIALLVIALAVGGYLIYHYMAERPSAPAAVKPQDTIVTRQPPVVVNPADTAFRRDSVAVAPATAPAAGVNGAYVVVLNAYPARAAADKRARTLSGYGHSVEVVARDSSNYFVVARVKAQPADTARMLDSLRRTFNPKGVHILR